MLVRVDNLLPENGQLAIPLSAEADSPLERFVWISVLVLSRTCYAR